jgi:hypothetical protein
MSHNPSYSGVKRASDAPRALQLANKRVKAHGDAPPVRHAKDAGCALGTVNAISHTASFPG